MSAVQAVADLVAGVALAAADDDPEAAHSREDEAWETALEWIAEHGDVPSRELAAAALQTRQHDFKRWC